MTENNTRKEFLEKVKGKVLGEDECPFCDDLSPEGYKGREVVKTLKHWHLLYNLYPYVLGNKHIMAIPKRHISFSTEINDEELLEMKDIYKFVKNFYGNEDYFSCTRETMGCRSIEHFHIHFLPGKLYADCLIEMLKEQGFPTSTNN